MAVRTARNRPEAGRKPGRKADRVPSTVDGDLALLAKAIGHPARVAILRHLLAKGGCICGSLVEILPIAQSTVSQHLKVMKEAGLVQGEIDGPRICYCARPSAVQRLKELVAEL